MNTEQTSKNIFMYKFKIFSLSVIETTTLKYCISLCRDLVLHESQKTSYYKRIED